MRIAVFVEHFPPSLGSDRRIYELMRRLTHKHSIDFIVFPPIRTLVKTEGQKKASLHSRNSLKVWKHAGIVGYYIAMPAEIAQLWRHSLIIAYLLTSLYVAAQTVKTLLRTRPDIVVLNYPSPYTGLVGYLSAKLLRKPVVLDFNDLIAQYTIELLEIREPSFKAKLLLLFQQYIVKNSDRIVVPTLFLKNYATSRKTPKTKIAIVPNGVDTKIFKPRIWMGEEKGGPTKNEKICLYAGRLDTWAGTGIVARLCDTALQKNLSVKFVLAGSGAEGSFTKQNVVLIGEVPYDRIPSLLMNADVVLVPFPNSEVSHAASPIKLFEGMAMEKPVVASRTSGIEEVVVDGKNGFLADPDDLGEWFEKLEKVLGSDALAENVGRDARRTVEERFDWAYLANRFNETLSLAKLKH